MSGWRHADRGWDKACGAECDDWSGATANCGCADPQPDPASPCVVMSPAITWRGGQPFIPARPCGDAATNHFAKPNIISGPSAGDEHYHPHIASLCSNCDHDITEIP